MIVPIAKAAAELNASARIAQLNVASSIEIWKMRPIKMKMHTNLDYRLYQK